MIFESQKNMLEYRILEYKLSEYSVKQMKKCYFELWNLEQTLNKIDDSSNFRKYE